MAELRVTDDVDASVDKTARMNGQETKDGHYFLKLHLQQVKAIEALAETAEKDLQGCENEEACGILRAAAGKARLLIAQKLNQFQGLCQKNIEQSISDDFPTTNEDLAGFWDMVMIQVEDVKSQFNEIQRLKKNDWKPDNEKTEDSKGSAPKQGLAKKAAKKVIDPKAKEASRARDEARRKLIEERRRAMKEQQKQNNNDVVVV